MIRLSAWRGSCSSWSTASAGQGAPQAPYIGYMSVRRDNRITIFTMDPASGKVAYERVAGNETGCRNADAAKHARHHAVTSPSRRTMSASNALISLSITASSRGGS